MATSGELIAAAIESGCERLAVSVVSVAIALGQVARAIDRLPRRPLGVGEDPGWPGRTPGKHT